VSSGPATFKINLNVTPEEGGDVAIDGTIRRSFPVDRTFEEGSVVQLKAQPLSGYEFVGWSGDIESSENPVEVNMEFHMAVVANFAIVQHDLTVDINGQGATAPKIGTHPYDLGTTVSLRATPDQGWQFDGWDGKVADPASATTIIVIDSDKDITANFSQIMHSLSTRINGSGTITPPLDDQSYAEGSEISITATPDKGWQFDGWEGDVADPTAATTTLIVDSDKSVTANFSPARPKAVIIGIIAGAVGAGLAAFFIPRRKKPKPEPETTAA
jgi:uncharacterized repeat protein (TIGR02543 family)